VEPKLSTNSDEVQSPSTGLAQVQERLTGVDKKYDTLKPQFDESFTDVDEKYETLKLQDG
jgi:hypothetical protein